MTDKVCPDCTEGIQEEYDCNIGSAAMCCGGCFKYVPCKTCNGDYEINENEENE